MRLAPLFSLQDQLNSILGFSFGCHAVSSLAKNMFNDCKALLNSEISSLAAAAARADAVNKAAPEYSSDSNESEARLSPIRTRRAQMLENDPTSVIARPKIHVILFGDQDQPFDHEGCTMGCKSSHEVEVCDGCASNFHMKGCYGDGGRVDYR